MIVSKPTGYYKNVYLNPEDYLRSYDLNSSSRRRKMRRNLILFALLLLAVITIFYLI